MGSDKIDSNKKDNGDENKTKILKLVLNKKKKDNNKNSNVVNNEKKVSLVGVYNRLLEFFNKNNDKITYILNGLERTVIKGDMTHEEYEEYEEYDESIDEVNNTYGEDVENHVNDVKLIVNGLSHDINKSLTKDTISMMFLRNAFLETYVKILESTSFEEIIGFIKKDLFEDLKSIQINESILRNKSEFVEIIGKKGIDIKLLLDEDVKIKYNNIIDELIDYFGLEITTGLKNIYSFGDFNGFGVYRAKKPIVDGEKFSSDTELNVLMAGLLDKGRDFDYMLDESSITYSQILHKEFSNIFNMLIEKKLVELNDLNYKTLYDEKTGLKNKNLFNKHINILGDDWSIFSFKILEDNDMIKRHGEKGRDFIYSLIGEYLKNTYEEGSFYFDNKFVVVLKNKEDNLFKGVTTYLNFNNFLFEMI